MVIIVFIVLHHVTSYLYIKHVFKLVVVFFFQTTVKYNVMKSGDSTFEINTNITSSQHTIDKITVHVCIR